VKDWFQSPSHRGGSAANATVNANAATANMFQSPSHRGGSAAALRRDCWAFDLDDVSIPFSSGRQRCLFVSQGPAGKAL
jgi:hypothetical protein